MSALTTISIILQLVPTILELIKAVETEIPDSGKGSEKLTFVKEVITAAYPQVVEIWGLVDKIITAAVNLYNATNTFKK
jgi:hypothetical protein